MEEGAVYLEQNHEKGMIVMTGATLSKWGNSMAVRIPNQVVRQLHLVEGIELQVIVTPENDILLRPAVQPEETNEDLRLHLKMLLSKIKPDSPRHEEIDLGIEGDELL